MRRRTKMLLAAASLVSIVCVNAVAFLHARAMTRFAADGQRTARPEDLSAWHAARVVLEGVNIPRPENSGTPSRYGLAFERHRFPTSEGRILDAWYIPGEAGRLVVVVFHGYAASKSALLPVAHAMHALGHSVMLVDFYGSGGSSGSGTSVGYLEANDVAAAVAYTERTWPTANVVLYGFSMGGAAILRAIAVERVRPAGIILEATFDSLLNTVKTRFAQLGLPATPFAQVLLFWGSVQWGFNAFAHNPSEYASLVECPALILQGGSDARVPEQQARNLEQGLANSRLVLFPGVPHMLIVTAEREAWTSAVENFLAAL